MAEVPWFKEPPRAMLKWQPKVPKDFGLKTFGSLHFYGPDGKKAVIHVTREKTTQVTISGAKMNVWHIEERGTRTLIVSPSVHFVGFWHSPNPVTFHRVRKL